MRHGAHADPYETPRTHGVCINCDVRVTINNSSALVCTARARRCTFGATCGGCGAMSRRRRVGSDEPRSAVPSFAPASSSLHGIPPETRSGPLRPEAASTEMPATPTRARTSTGGRPTAQGGAPSERAGNGGPDGVFKHNWTIFAMLAPPVGVCISFGGDLLFGLALAACLAGVVCEVAGVTEGTVLSAIIGASLCALSTGVQAAVLSVDGSMWALLLCILLPTVCAAVALWVLVNVGPRFVGGVGGLFGEPAVAPAGSVDFRLRGGGAGPSGTEAVPNTWTDTLVHSEGLLFALAPGLCVGVGGWGAASVFGSDFLPWATLFLAVIVDVVTARTPSASFGTVRDLPVVRGAVAGINAVLAGLLPALVLINFYRPTLSLADHAVDIVAFLSVPGVVGLMLWYLGSGRHPLWWLGLRKDLLDMACVARGVVSLLGIAVYISHGIIGTHLGHTFALREPMAGIVAISSILLFMVGVALALDWNRFHLPASAAFALGWASLGLLFSIPWLVVLILIPGTVFAARFAQEYGSRNFAIVVGCFFGSAVWLAHRASGFLQFQFQSSHLASKIVGGALPVSAVVFLIAVAGSLVLAAPAALVAEFERAKQATPTVGTTTASFVGVLLVVHALALIVIEGTLHGAPTPVDVGASSGAPVYPASFVFGTSALGVAASLWLSGHGRVARPLAFVSCLLHVAKCAVTLEHSHGAKDASWYEFLLGSGQMFRPVYILAGVMLLATRQLLLARRDSVARQVRGFSRSRQLHSGLRATKSGTLVLCVATSSAVGAVGVAGLAFAGLPRAVTLFTTQGEFAGQHVRSVAHIIALYGLLGGLMGWMCGVAVFSPIKLLRVASDSDGARGSTSSGARYMALARGVVGSASRLSVVSIIVAGVILFIQHTYYRQGVNHDAERVAGSFLVAIFGAASLVVALACRMVHGPRHEQLWTAFVGNTHTACAFAAAFGTHVVWNHGSVVSAIVLSPIMLMWTSSPADIRGRGIGSYYPLVLTVSAVFIGSSLAHICLWGYASQIGIIEPPALEVDVESTFGLAQHIRGPAMNLILALVSLPTHAQSLGYLRYMEPNGTQSLWVFGPLCFVTVLLADVSAVRWTGVWGVVLFIVSVWADSRVKRASARAL